MTVSDQAISKAAARRIYLAVFFLTAGIYLSTLTANYYWDGITFALQIERAAAGPRGAALLFHQNHLLYSAVGCLLYRLVHAIGLGFRALEVLQIANALIGAAAVAVVCRIAHRATGSLHASIASAAILALSAAWWRLSTDADAYMQSVLFILLSLSHLLSSKPRWAVAGILMAGAMLIHELAALFSLAALAPIARASTIPRKVRFAVAMGLTAWGVTIFAYAVIGWLLYGMHGPIGIISWALSNPSGVTAAISPLRGLLLIPKGNIDLLLGHNLILFRRQGIGINVLIAAGSLACALAFGATLFRGIRDRSFTPALSDIRQRRYERYSAFAPTLASWAGVYLLFLLFWEPWQVYYRVFYAPALILALSHLLARSHLLTNAMLFRLTWPAIVTLGLANLALYIAPNMHGDANAVVAAARGAQWNERTVVYFAEHGEADTAFEYFNPASDWRRLNPGSPDALESEVSRAYYQGGSVWLNGKAAGMVDSGWLIDHASGRQIKVDTESPPVMYIEVLPQGLR